MLETRSPCLQKGKFITFILFRRFSPIHKLQYRHVCNDIEHLSIEHTLSLRINSIELTSIPRMNLADLTSLLDDNEDVEGIGHHHVVPSDDEEENKDNEDDQTCKESAHFCITGLFHRRFHCAKKNKIGAITRSRLNIFVQDFQAKKGNTLKANSRKRM